VTKATPGSLEPKTVTDDGKTVQMELGGPPEHPSETVPRKLFRPVTVTRKMPSSPGKRVSEVGKVDN
jgi:hypothetical protein